MRIKNDQYFTPPQIIVPLLKQIKVRSVFEPCAGDGAIVKVLHNHPDEFVCIETGDIDRKMPVTFSGFDATKKDEWNEVGEMFCPDWVITNPPYKQPDCDAIIQNAWDFAEEGIAMLLRLSYLEPCKGRADFLKSAPLSHLIILNPRPQFIPGKKSTDSSTVAWFVWQKNWKQMSTRITFCDDWRDD